MSHVLQLMQIRLPVLIRTTKILRPLSIHFLQHLLDFLHGALSLRWSQVRDEVLRSLGSTALGVGSWGDQVCAGGDFQAGSHELSMQTLLTLLGSGSMSCCHPWDEGSGMDQLDQECLDWLLQHNSSWHFNEHKQKVNV